MPNTFLTKAYDWLFRGGYYQNRSVSLSGALGSQSDAGISVNELSALQSTTVFACLRLISTNVGSLPLGVYQRTEAGREKAFKHPAYTLLHDSPNPNMTAVEWKSLSIAHLLMYGNAFSFVERLGQTPLNIWPLRPDRMKIQLADDGTLSYEYATGTGKKFFTQTDILHFRVFTLDGLEGLSPISYARNAIGLALQTEKFGSSFYRNGARPSGILKHPNSLSPEAAKRLQESFQAQYGGTDNIGKLLLLENGLQYEAITIKPEDAEYIATRKFQTIEICRVFGVPPHLVAELDKPTYGSVEAQKDEFLSFTIRPYLNSLEQTINKTLFTGTDFYAKFTIADFLRSSIDARYKAYATAIQWGFLSPNEVREMEELNNREGGEDFLSPLNMRLGLIEPNLGN